MILYHIEKVKNRSICEQAELICNEERLSLLSLKWARRCTINRDDVEEQPSSCMNL